jgi:hypothetical protein
MQVLVLQDETYYTIRLSDGAAHQLSLPPSCAGPVAVTSDAHRLACVGGAVGCVDCFVDCTACFGTSVDAVSLLPGELGHDIALAAGDAFQFGVLSWSPDQRHLVVQLKLPPDGHCALGLYMLQTVAEGPAKLTALLSPQGVDACSLSQLAWSPDGAFIAWLQYVPGEAMIVDALRVASLPAVAFWAGAVPVTLVPAVGRLLSLPPPSDDPFTALPHIAWMPQGEALTVTMAAGYKLVQVDVASRAQRTLLTLPTSASPIQVFTWLNDGRHVVFAIGHGGTEYCAGPPYALYVDTIAGAA